MRTIVRLLLIAIVVIVAFVLLASWPGSPFRRNVSPPAGAVGMSGYIDTQRAREIGAEIGEKAAVAGEQVKETTHDAAITTKIKAKMALDDFVKARSIDVSTDGSTVTLSGSVGSTQEHDRAVALARETAGVTNVIDRLAMR